ncbi:hypothetical protein JCM8097_006403 [Rhodosporidiobolus ruineniae]
MAANYASLLPQPPANGAISGSPMLVGHTPALLAGASPLVGGSTPLPTTATPRRPSLPPSSSSAIPGYGQAGTSLQINHAAALRAQQQSNRTLPTASSPNPLSAPALPAEGGPEHKVPVHRAFSRIRETEPGEVFPSIPSGADQDLVKSWIDRDVAYEDELGAAKTRRNERAKEMYDEGVREQDWLGPLEAQPRGKFELRWPQDKAAREAKGKRGPLRTPVPLSKAQLRASAAEHEHLIPIRLDIEHEVYKLRDTFTWNLKETTITPRMFAQHLLADLRFPQEPFLKHLVASIEKQIADAQPSSSYSAHVDVAAVEGGREESRRWFEERARKRRRLGKEKEEGEYGVTDGELMGEGEGAVALGEVPVPLGASDELRVLIKLDITLDTVQLVDKFEWDLGNPDNSPEEFAETFATELGLTGEFATAIAHAIREQLDIYTRSLFLLNYSKSHHITDDDLRREFLPSLLDPSASTGVFRTDFADDFTPLLNQLTREDVDRNEKEHDRDSRRKRRQTKGRGVVLPDREPARTNRTLVPRSQPGLVRIETDQRGHKTFHLPELNEPFAVAGRVVPPKPANLDTSESSPLRLLLSTRGGAASVGPAPGGGGSHALAAAAAANRFRAGQASLGAGGGGAAGGGGLGAGESPVKGAGMGGARKKPPVLRANAEELGLHEHIIDGLWFCANCGCPGQVAIGRRKGPTGKDSLCGTCGKYFHRYKRQRPCVYTRDLDTHLRHAAEEAAKGKTSRSKKAAAAVLDAAARASSALQSQSGSARDTPVSQLAMSPASSTHELEHNQDDDQDFHDDGDDSDASAPSPRKPKRGGYYGSPDTPFVQLDSDDSDEEESVAGGSPPVTRRAASPPPPPQAPQAAPPAASVVPPQPSAAPAGPQPLPWMVAAAAELRAKQVDDRFEIIPRPRPADPAVQEWRIRCLDCPGKLYNLGPGETLDGFLVHFKNRVHRTNVETRLAKERAQ